MIAIALACNPKVLIADEPTTALDVTIQAQILDLVKRLRRESGMAIVWITHDLGVMAGLADRIMVMYGGLVVERASVGALYKHPRQSIHPRPAQHPAEARRYAGGAPGEHPRTAAEPDPASLRVPVRAAAAAMRSSAAGARIPCWRESRRGTKWPAGSRRALNVMPDPQPSSLLRSGCRRGAQPLLAVENLTRYFPIMQGVFRRQVGTVKAVDGLDFEIHERETLGLVGESGCGKSTAGRVILRLHDATAGRIVFRGTDITSLEGEALRRLRPRMQMIFQDPQDSLNPRMTVGSILGEPLLEHGVAKAGALRERVEALLESVGLDPGFTTATRTNSPGASVSASGWRAPSPWTPNSSSATNRSPPSTCPSRLRW